MPLSLLETAVLPHNSLLCFLPSLCAVCLHFSPNPHSSFLTPFNILPCCYHLLPLLLHLLNFLWVVTPASPLPSSMSSCFSVTSTNVCPTPCPVLWLTSWTFTSDHLWPRRPDPGAEGNTFLLSLLLGFKQTNKRKKKEKQTADWWKLWHQNVSRSHSVNTSWGKRCRMCRVSHHHSADIPIVWQSDF